MKSQLLVQVNVFFTVNKNRRATSDRPPRRTIESYRRIRGRLSRYSYLSAPHFDFLSALFSSLCASSGAIVAPKRRTVVSLASTTTD